MPEEGVEWIPHGSILTYEEIFFLIRILCEFGVKKIRFTGGEPLIRKGMIQFLEKVTASFPGLQVALTTNGSTLTQYAPSLARMELTSINISLDTLDAGKFSAITRGALLEPVLEGIDALASLVSRDKTEIKINTVLVRGFNDDDMVTQLTDYAFKKGIILRFIEFMPLNSNLWSTEMYVPFSEVFTRLTLLSENSDQWTEEKIEENPSSGPARYYVNTATGQRIGVISAVSRHFCGSCNRLRVTSTGNIRPCLFDNGYISIAEALKTLDEKKLRELLHEATAMKPEAGAVRRKTTPHEATCREDIRMHTIGG